MEKTANGIEFDSELAGDKGARFILKPTKKNTKKEIHEARVWLHSNRDVVSIKIEIQ